MDNYAINIDKIRISAVFRVPDVVRTVVVETCRVSHTESNYLISIFDHKGVVAALKEIDHLCLRN